MLVDVLVLLFLAIVAKAITPLNRRLTNLWGRGFVGKVLVIVIAFLATAQTSAFLFDVMNWGAPKENLGVAIGSAYWWGIKLAGFGFVAGILLLLLWLGSRSRRSNRGA